MLAAATGGVYDGKDGGAEEEAPVEKEKANIEQISGVIRLERRANQG